MVASIKSTFETRERLHNLNLDMKEHQEYYDVIAEKFIWQNEGYWNNKTNKLSFQSANGDDIRVAKKDTKGNMTVGVGFNMDGKGSRKEWKKCFGETESFDQVFLGAKMSSEDVVTLFRHGIAVRRNELKSFFGKDWNVLKPNEKLAIEDLYFNGGPGLALYSYIKKDGVKAQKKDTRFAEHIRKYSQTSDLKALLAAVDEVKNKSNREQHQGLQNRRDVEALLLSSHECALYSKPNQEPIPIDAKLNAVLGETIVPRDSYDICMKKYMRTGETFHCIPFEYKKVDHLYIWRTQMDDKVRTSHLERDGKIFDDRLEEEHPEKDYGCRCIADYNIPIWVNIVK